MPSIRESKDWRFKGSDYKRWTIWEIDLDSNETGMIASAVGIASIGASGIMGIFTTVLGDVFPKIGSAIPPAAFTEIARSMAKYNTGKGVSLRIELRDDPVPTRFSLSVKPREQ